MSHFVIPRIPSPQRAIRLLWSWVLFGKAPQRHSGLEESVRSSRRHRHMVHLQPEQRPAPTLLLPPTPTQAAQSWLRTWSSSASPLPLAAHTQEASPRPSGTKKKTQPKQKTRFFLALGTGLRKIKQTHTGKVWVQSLSKLHFLDFIILSLWHSY